MPVFKKENIYCIGSEKLAKVLKVIKSKGINVAPDERHWNNSRNSFAYSPTCKNGTISYASDINFYKEPSLVVNMDDTLICFRII